MSTRPLNIKVRDSAFDPDEYGLDPFDFKAPPGRKRIVHVDMSGSKPAYKIWLYLVGNDVPYVESVTYMLHHTFPDPVRTVRRTLENPQCQLVIWTWGLFEVRAVVTDKRGGRVELIHKLTYGKQLKMKDVESVYEG